MNLTLEEIQDHNAPNEIRAHMENRVQVGASTPTRLAVTGEPYITLTIGGLKAEGECHQVVTTNIEAAKTLFLAEFDKYAAGKDGVLYWRSYPSINVREYPVLDYGRPTKDQYFTISARFLISSASQIQPVKEGAAC